MSKINHSGKVMIDLAIVVITVMWFSSVLYVFIDFLCVSLWCSFFVLFCFGERRVKVFRMCFRATCTCG